MFTVAMMWDVYIESSSLFCNPYYGLPTITNNNEFPNQGQLLPGQEGTISGRVQLQHHHSQDKLQASPSYPDSVIWQECPRFSLSLSTTWAMKGYMNIISMDCSPGCNLIKGIPYCMEVVHSTAMKSCRAMVTDKESRI